MKLLIVNDEPDIRYLISFAAESKLNLKTITAPSGNEAIKLLKSDSEIKGVISDYNMPDGNGWDVYHFLKSTNSTLPFVLCTGSLAEDLKEFEGQNLSALLRKPFRWEELVSTLRNIFVTASLDNTSSDHEYLPVKLKTLARVNVMKADLYIKLAEEKFVKLIRKGDTFSQTDYQHYADKQIDCLYLKRKECDDFLSKFTTEVMTLSLAKTLPWTSSCDVLESAYETVHNTILTFGFTKEAQDLAKASAHLAIKTIVHLPKLSELFLHTDSNHYLYRHSTLLAQLSCLVASAIGWTSESTQYKLSLASFLHDISIKDADLAMLEIKNGEDQELLKKNEKRMAAFRKHPEEASLLLSTFKELPPDVSDIILHHHEKPDGSGFPLGLKSKSLDPLPSLFIISQDIVNFVWEKGGNASFAEFLKHKHNAYRDDHFAKLASGLATL